MFRYHLNSKMDIRINLGLAFITCWAYFCFASVTQQHAIIQYYDKRYFSEARAFTGRRRRGDAYLTNITIVTLETMDNNITLRVIISLKSIGSIMLHDMKLCDGNKISWIKEIRDTYSNFTDCPVLAGRYQMSNLEIPPRSYPMPVPKGEGTLHLYAYLTQNMHLVFHGYMKVISS